MGPETRLAFLKLITAFEAYLEALHEGMLLEDYDDVNDKIETFLAEIQKLVRAMKVAGSMSEANNVIRLFDDKRQEEEKDK